MEMDNSAKAGPEEISVDPSGNARNSLATEQERFFRYKILYECLKLTLKKARIAQSARDDPCEQESDVDIDPRVCDLTEHFLRVAETVDLYRDRMEFTEQENQSKEESEPFDEKSRGIFGLNEETLRESSLDGKKLRKQLETIRALVTPEVEIQLKRKCTDICDLYYPIDSLSSFDADDVKNLPKHVAIMKDQIDHLQSKVLHDQRRIDSLWKEYYEALQQQVNFLGVMLDKYKLADSAYVSQAKASHLETYCETMSMKLTVTEHQLLLDTYKPQKNEAILQISSQVENRFAQVEEENLQLQAQLDQYSNAGESYQSVVEEYRKLRKQINEKQTWISSLSIDTAL